MIRARTVSRKSRAGQPARHGPQLNQLIGDYLEQLEIRGRAAITARRYHDYLSVFAGWLGQMTGQAADSLRLSDLDPEHLRRYQLHLARRRDPRDGHVIGPSTRNLYQIALRNFLRYCRRRRGLEAPDPDEHLELAKERDVPIRHLRRAEAKRLAEALPLDEPSGLRDRAIVEVLFGTGCRVSELVALTQRQVDLARREAEIIGKGGRSRLLLLTEDAAHWLRRYLETRSDDAPWIFPSRQRSSDGEARPLTPRQVQNVIERAARRTGMPVRVSPHWFRHARLAILARRSGVEVAQRVAGHRSLNTTARYLRTTNEFLRRAFDDAERADADDERG